LLILTAGVVSACESDNPPLTESTAPEIERARATALLPTPDLQARGNASTHGIDRTGRRYQIQYQPDWVSRITVTERNSGSDPATAVLFRNAGFKLSDPGPVVRTRIASPDHGVDFEVIINDPGRVVKRITVETVPANAEAHGETLEFTIEDRLPPPPPPGDDTLST